MGTLCRIVNVSCLFFLCYNTYNIHSVYFLYYIGAYILYIIKIKICGHTLFQPFSHYMLSCDRFSRNLLPTSRDHRWGPGPVTSYCCVLVPDPPVLRPVRAEAGKGSEYPGRCLVTPGPGRPGCTAGPTPRPRRPPARPAPCKTHPRSTARGDTNGHVTKRAKNDTRDPAEVRTEDLGPPHLSG